MVGKERTMSKKKSKPCSYYSGVQPWKNKRQQKQEYDRKQEQEVFEKLDLDNTLDTILENVKRLEEAIIELVKNLYEGEQK